MQILRSMFAVFAGLVLLSVIVEPLEFGLVTLVNGEVTTDPDIYFRVRNTPAFLAAKVVYNTAAAIVGGWVAARLAPRAGWQAAAPDEPRGCIEIVSTTVNAARG
jgi:hypothetical protein